MLENNSSVSRRNACAQVVVEVREQQQIRHHALTPDCAAAATGPAKFATSASARGSAIIRRTCASSTPGSRSCPAIARSSNSSSGMLVHRKNDSRDASSSVADPVCGADAAGLRRRLPRGTGTPGSRACARDPRGCRRRSRRPRSARWRKRRAAPQGRRRPRAAGTRASRASRKSRSRTGLLGSRRGLAHEHPLANRRVAHAFHLERPRDVRGLEPRQAGRIVCFLGVAQRRLPGVLLECRALDPGEADLVRAGAIGMRGDVIRSSTTTRDARLSAALSL